MNIDCKAFQEIHPIWWVVLTTVLSMAVTKVLPLFVPDGTKELAQRIVRYTVNTTAVAGGVVVVWCLWNAYRPAAASTPPAPEITKFRAQAPSIERGASTRLEWEVSGATDVVIDQGIGKVAASSTAEIHPDASVIYLITAAGPGGKVTKAYTVEVTAPPAVPPPVATGDPARPALAQSTAPPEAVAPPSAPVATVSVRLKHHRVVGDSPLGSLTVSADGMTWSSDHARDSFESLSCASLVLHRENPDKLSFDFKNGGKPWRFLAATKDDFDALHAAYRARCPGLTIIDGPAIAGL